MRRVGERGKLACTGWLLAAGAVHALPVVALVVSPRPAEARRAVPIEVTFAPEPPPVGEAEPKRTPAPEPPAAPERAPAPRPRAPRARPAPAPAPAAPAPAPRRVVGLSLGATVEGDGPAFAVGNTLEGRTARVAATPSAAPAPPPAAPAAPSLNRRAQQDPEAEVALVRPQRLAALKPRYPDALRAQGAEADVVVQVELTTTGAVRAARISRPAPEPDFNAAALAAAWQERFSPATRDGVPIEYTLTFTYRFRASD